MRVRSVVVRYPLLVAATLSVLFPLESTTVAAANEDAVGSPIFGVTLPPGYREWPFVSIAHAKRTSYSPGFPGRPEPIDGRPGAVRHQRYLT